MKDLLMTIVENQHSKMMSQEQEAESHSWIGWDEVDGGLYLVSGTSSLQKGTISNEDDDDTIAKTDLPCTNRYDLLRSYNGAEQLSTGTAVRVYN